MSPQLTSYRGCSQAVDSVIRLKLWYCEQCLGVFDARRLRSLPTATFKAPSTGGALVTRLLQQPTCSLPNP